MISYKELRQACSWAIAEKEIEMKYSDGTWSKCYYNEYPHRLNIYCFGYRLKKKK